MYRTAASNEAMRVLQFYGSNGNRSKLSEEHCNLFKIVVSRADARVTNFNPRR